jgi:hypothetical protein
LIAPVAWPSHGTYRAGQFRPYNWFPWAALAIVVVSAVYAFIANSRDPGLGERAGSIVADE